MIIDEGLLLDTSVFLRSVSWPFTELCTVPCLLFSPRYTCTSDAMLGEFENGLFPIFTEIIQRDVTGRLKDLLPVSSFYDRKFYFSLPKNGR